uniref:Uncharacterized protein n=1 Tax=Ditylenchus dipsaci TaxID=166011 RepID=A0A915CKC3_9BILA
MKGLFISLFFLNLYLQVSYEHYVNLQDFEVDQIVPKSQLIQRASRAIVTQRSNPIESIESASEIISSEQHSNILEGSGEVVQSPQLKESKKRSARQTLASGAEVVSEEESSGEEPSHRVKREEQHSSVLHMELDGQGSGEQPDKIPNAAVIQVQSSKQKRASVAASTMDEGSGQEEPV